MAVLKKYAEKLSQPLTSYTTFVNDSNTNSTYFRITEFKDAFTGGKNGFLLAGSEHLKETTEIKIQILDVNGNPVYYEPGGGIPEYYEGVSKLISVHIYDDTPIGLGKITILGELKTYIDNNGIVRDIPNEWKGSYNCKWERNFQINKLLPNEDRVRFYKRPKVTIDEIVKPIYSTTVTSITQTGSVNGISLVPIEGQRLDDFNLPTSYLLKISDTGSNWTGSIVGSNLTLTDLNFTSTVSDIISNTDIIIKTPYTENGYVKNIINQPYSTTFNYVYNGDSLKTALSGSFAKITISDLTTIVGDVSLVKIFRKSQSDLADYQFIQEIQLESNEILTDLESADENFKNYGTFDPLTYTNYWITSSTYIETEFNQEFLYNSLKIDSIGLNELYTYKNIQLSAGNEYTFGFNIRLDKNISPNNYVKVFISGSRSASYNNVATTLQIKQPILTVESSDYILQKTQLVSNFKAEQIENTKLYFEIVGNGWYISDVTLKASQETSYSPDEIVFIQPIPRTLATETFNFLFQFYDINNNYIPVDIKESKTFSGGNLNTIQKSLQLTPSSLYFQFDSGSGNGNPLPPNVISFDIVKNYLTGSVTFTSRSFDSFNNELSSSQYSTQVTPGYTEWQFPGLLNDIGTDSPYLTVQNFTGSRDPALDEIVVQYIQYIAECEGITDSIIISRVLDGKGGVNYEIRPYNGTIIRNSNPNAALEIQAIRIDGINEINLKSGLPSGFSTIQLHVQSGSTYIPLQQASDTNYIIGLQPGLTGSGELNYNAIFNRESIDTERTVYLIPSGSPNPSASILTSLTLSDLLDGLDAGVVTYDADVFTVNPRINTTFTPQSSNVTASFYRRGTVTSPISASFTVYPSMSINNDIVPEYWMYYSTQSIDSDLTIVARDESGVILQPTLLNEFIGYPTSQSKQLLINVIYTEPYTSASVSVDKLFTIIPEGKPGDEPIVFESIPTSVTLQSDSSGRVIDYSPTVTELRLKQGSRYLVFTGSREPGTFHIATGSIISKNITVGNVHFYNSYTQSLILSASYDMTDISASIELPLEIQPYYTSSVYTASFIQRITKVLDGDTGPGIVMRGLWNEYTDYIGNTFATDYRRDAIIFPDPSGSGGITHYWSALSGSGPNTLDANSVTIGAKLPTSPISASYVDTDYWQYLGQQDFFVSAKIAIFDESFVKNTINVGNNPDSSFGNIVIAGGRTDPYISIGQNGTIGVSGDQSSLGVIGYDRAGIFLGMYEDGTNGTSGRFSIKSKGGTPGARGLNWDGNTLTIIGAIRQTVDGNPEGSFRGIWSASVQYWIDDTVLYNSASYISNTNHISTNDTNIDSGFPYIATNAWSAYAASGTNGTSGTSGTSGSIGAGVVYRGNFSTENVYYKTNNRVDVVRQESGGSNYWLANNLSLNNQSGSVWGVPSPSSSNWTPFGTEFSSVATDILLAQDATITHGLVIGESGTDIGFIRSANANTFEEGNGFYLDATGRIRFGEPEANNFKYDLQNFQITGSINATDGNIGNWIIDDTDNGGALRDITSAVVLDPTLPELGFYVSGSRKLKISPVNSLSDVSSSDVNVIDIPNGDGTPYDFTSPNDQTSNNTVNYVYSAYTSGSSALTPTTYAIPSAGTYIVNGLRTLSVFSVDTQGGSIFAQADAPSYNGTYPGQRHYGIASGKKVIAELYIEAHNQSTGEITRKLLQTVQSISATSEQYWVWNGSIWTLNITNTASINTSYNTGGYQSITNQSFTFSSAGNYKFGYSIRVGVVSGYSQNRNSDGTLAPIVYTTHTSGINTSDTDGGIGYTADSIVIIVPANIVELTAGGIQIANDTNTFTKFVRYDSPAGNMMLGQVKNGYLQLNPYNDDETQYSIQSYGTIYAGGGLFVGGSEDLSGNWEYGGISLSNTQKSGNIRSSIYLFGDLHPANTNWGVSGGPHISTRNMGSNSGTGVYWDEIYADNFNNLSDIRIKENIYDSDLGLDFINNLRPVKYNFKNSNKKRTRYGFIAQEVLSALTLSGKSTDEFRGLSTGSSIIKTVEKLYGKNIHEIISSGSITGSNGTLYDQRWYENEQQNAAWNLSYTEFISPMIKAIQELSKKVSILEAKLSGSI